MSLIDEFRNDVAGLALLKDWLGDGTEPVSQARADHRANACLHGDGGNPCPHNCEPNWWGRVKSSIANTIQMQLEMKHHLRLHVASEDACFMCRICGCALPLKVWTPIEHIKQHTTPDQLEKYPAWCWQKQEIER